MMEEQGSLFSDDEIEQLETPESKIAKTANEIFRRWYVQWYKNRYTQSPSFIAKEIKNAIKSGIDPFELEWAANILGDEGKPINALNFQWSLARVHTAMNAQGMNTQHSEDKDYGESF